MSDWEESLDPEFHRRLIAYHDSICDSGCGDDISTYPIPPKDWEEH